MTAEGTHNPRSRPSVISEKLARFLIDPWDMPAGPGERRKAQLLATISLALSVGLLIGSIAGPSWIRAHAVLLLFGIPSYLLSRTKYYEGGALLFAFGGIVYAYLSVNLGSSPNLQSAVIMIALVWLVLASGILPRAVLAVLGIAATILTFTAPLYTPAAADANVGMLGGVVLAVSAILYGLRSYHDLVEVADLEDLQNENRELQRSHLDLELHLGVQAEELADRSRESVLRSADLDNAKDRAERQAARLAAISKVIQSVASITELRELLFRVADLISRHFGYYHVGIFLLDEAGEYAVLAAANSDGGRRMLARQHRLRIGTEGVVGMVAATRQPRTSLIVGIDPVYFSNPDLPETQSETAIPLQNAGHSRLIGVLDLQSMELGGFSDEDIQILELLGNLLGVAIENIQIGESTQRMLSEAEVVRPQDLGSGWDRFAGEQHPVGYRFDLTGASPFTKPVLPSDQPTPEPEYSPTNQVGVPIELRGEVLGELRVQAPAGKKWSQDELDLIKAVAERVAISAENAQLFEETNRRAERERMVSEITSKIRSTNDPNEMINRAMQELKRALGVSRVEVRPQTASGKADTYEA